MLAGIGTRFPRQLLRSPFDDNVSAVFPTFRSEIDDPIRRLDHMKVMLDDHHGVTQPHQPVLFASEHPVVQELRELDVSTMTPLEAINRLYELQRQTKE